MVRLKFPMQFMKLENFITLSILKQPHGMDNIVLYGSFASLK